MAGEKGSVLFSLVSRGAVVLAEQGSDKTEAARAARGCQKDHGKAQRLEQPSDVLAGQPPVPHPVREWDHLLVYGRRGFGKCPFAFLEDIKQRFSSQYGATVSTALAYAYNTEFSRVLR